MLRFEGAQCLRQRLVCATLLGRPLRIDNIRSTDENPGLRDYEASLLRLIEKISNGCVVEINETGRASSMQHACMRACMRVGCMGVMRASRRGPRGQPRLGRRACGWPCGGH